MRCVRNSSQTGNTVLKPRVVVVWLDYRHFMMELAKIGMLKYPVNINFAKVIVFIKKTVFVTPAFVVWLMCVAPLWASGVASEQKLSIYPWISYGY